MSDPVIESFGYQAITASTIVSTNRTRLAGIFVSTASTSPTIAVFDSATAATTVTMVAAFTPVAGTFYPMPFLAKNGIYVQLVGTISCTVAAEGL